MALTVKATRALTEFKKKIIPNILNMTFEKAMSDFDSVIRVSGIFAQYSDNLESRGFITPETAQEMELKFLAIVKKVTK